MAPKDSLAFEIGNVTVTLSVAKIQIQEVSITLATTLRSLVDMQAES